MSDASALSLLRRLRHVEVLAARCETAGRLAEEDVAKVALANAQRALAEESLAAGERPADFAAWLPAGLARRSRCVAERDHASQASAAAGAALAMARAAEKATETLLAERRAQQVRAERRREQVWLDDLVVGRAARMR